MLVQAKTGLQFRFLSEASYGRGWALTTEMGTLVYVGGWGLRGRVGVRLVCYRMPVITENTLDLPVVYFGESQGVPTDKP